MNPSDPSRLEIPILYCPHCRNRPMVIKAVTPRSFKREETKVTFRCPKCETCATEVIKAPD